MSSLSPELWHIVASHLSIHDATQLRLVNRFFADIAGAHIIPHVSFYMHQDDIARLRGIAANGVIAPSVRSLVYFTTLYQSPAVTFDAFKKYHEDKIRWTKMRLFRSDADVSDIKPAEDPTVLSEFEKYKHLVAVQEQMKVDMADLKCLKDALANFTGLRHATMSSGNQFFGRPRREQPSPFNTPFELPIEWSRPEGVRQLEVLLEALAHNKFKLDSLRAGIFEWVFFDKPTRELERLFQPVFDAVEVELEIGLDLDHDLNDLDGDTEKCRQLLERGMVRDLLSRMKRLNSLHVGFMCDLNVPEAKPAMLKDIASPSHHWPHLKQLELSSMRTDRHTLFQLLSLHRDTLRFLCLKDFDLGETSWQKLLPEMRNKLDLEDACICGTLLGRTEDDKGLPEIWELQTPDAWENDMRASVNCYCQRRGEKYPDELPLTDEVVRKNFDEHVRRHVRKSQTEEREEQDRVNEEMRHEWREAGLIPRRGNEDSEDSESGWNSYDSDDLDDEVDEWGLNRWGHVPGLFDHEDEEGEEEDSEEHDDDPAILEDLSQGDGSDGGAE